MSTLLLYKDKIYEFDGGNSVINTIYPNTVYGDRDVTRCDIRNIKLELMTEPILSITSKTNKDKYNTIVEDINDKKITSIIQVKPEVKISVSYSIINIKDGSVCSDVVKFVSTTPIRTISINEVDTDNNLTYRKLLISSIDVILNDITYNDSETKLVINDIRCYLDPVPTMITNDEYNGNLHSSITGTSQPSTSYSIKDMTDSMFMVYSSKENGLVFNPYLISSKQKSTIIITLNITHMNIVDVFDSSLLKKLINDVSGKLPEEHDTIAPSDDPDITG